MKKVYLLWGRFDSVTDCENHTAPTVIGVFLSLDGLEAYIDGGLSVNVIDWWIDEHELRG